MNHYEIVFLVHPDQKSDSEAILNKYCDQIKSSNGTIDRSENIGSRKLAYPIQDCYKANYFCINVTCDSDQIDSLKESFKYNDAILRHLIVRKDEIETEPSSLLKQTQEGPIKSGSNGYFVRFSYPLSVMRTWSSNLIEKSPFSGLTNASTHSTIPGSST